MVLVQHFLKTQRNTALSIVGIIVLCTTLPTVQAQETPADTVSTVQVNALIAEAIALGVPLYNQGLHLSCAAVYRIALQSLVLLAPSAVDVSNVADAILKAEEENPRDGAWTLRYALDDIYNATKETSVTTTPDFELNFGDGLSVSWFSINDNVMGGVSRGEARVTDNGTLSFAGQLSLANNGGFSSVRTRLDGYSLSGYDGLQLRVRGDGRQYRFLAGGPERRATWQQSFRADTEWRTVTIPFDQMEMSIRGWSPPSYPRISGERIQSIGLLIGDKNEQPFALEVDWIRGYRD